MKAKTLLLNVDYRPFDIIMWQKAFDMYFKNKAAVLHYHDKTIRDGKGNEYNIPSVMILYKYHNQNRHASYSKRNVLFRDNFTCQYCRRKQDPTELTVDHVIPRALWDNHKGSPSIFENVVACCADCNRIKGSKTLDKAGMRLLSQPKKVSRTQILAAKIKFTHHPEDWKAYLNV